MEQDELQQLHDLLVSFQETEASAEEKEAVGRTIGIVNGSIETETEETEDDKKVETKEGKEEETE